MAANMPEPFSWVIQTRREADSSRSTRSGAGVRMAALVVRAASLAALASDPLSSVPVHLTQSTPNLASDGDLVLHNRHLDNAPKLFKPRILPRALKGMCAWQRSRSNCP